MSATREILFNAFDMNCVVHQSPGLWRHPRDRADRYIDLSYWTDLAKILERGKFDALFLADVLGVYDVYGGNTDTALREATQIPLNDPLLTVSAMAGVTEKSRLRRDLHAILRAAVHLRAAHVDARPSDQGPYRLEYRHRLSG